MSRERVLVVEGDQGLGAALHDVLEKRGYEVTLAPTRRDALWGLRSGPRCPTAILLDCAMSELSPREFREHQKQSRAWADVPVIVLPGTPDADGAARAIGARAALHSPLDEGELLSLLAEVGTSRAFPPAPLARSA
jgi:CheY-like chemotaxis protein